MSKILVYEKPTCTKCRKVANTLSENGVDFEKVNYYIKPFSKTKLQLLLKKMKIKPSELLGKNEKYYKDLKFKEKNYTENQILDLMIKYHDLVQRTIVENRRTGHSCQTRRKNKETFLMINCYLNGFKTVPPLPLCKKS